jgi:hypothetical protein
VSPPGWAGPLMITLPMSIPSRGSLIVLMAGG